MTKINKILICYVILSALLGCLISCTKLTAPKPFWDQLGIQAEEIDEIRLTYRGQDVVLDAGDTDRFVQALTQSEPTTVNENHEFTPSDIGVTFAAGGKEYPVTFYWFPYHDIPLIELGATVDYAGPEYVPQYKLIGSRFDAIFGGAKYHYRFIGEAAQTEEKMRLLYDQIAKKNGQQVLAQLDGCDKSYSPPGLLAAESYTLEEILAQSDLIVLASYQGKRREGGRWYDYDRFHIDEVLKGVTEQSWCELPLGGLGKRRLYRNQIYIAYPPVYAPYFEKDEQYLICLKQEENEFESHYEYFGQYTTAVLDGDTLFPRFNTEDHPFYNVKLQEVRDRIAEIQ